MAESEKYFLAKKATRETNMQFQRDLMQMMLQMHQVPQQSQLQIPKNYYP